VLEASSAALNEAGGVEATFTVSGEAPGLFAQTVPSGTGTLRLIRRLPAEPGGPFTLAVRVTGSGRMTAAATEDVSFDAAFQPGRLAFLDHDKRTLIERPIDGRAPAGVSPGYAYVRSNMTLDALINPGAFAEEIGQAQSAALGSQDEEIDGVACDRVTLRFAKPEGGRSPGRARADVVTWWIGKGDRLPRKVEFLSETGMGNIARRITLTQVRARPELEASDVVPVAPEGYTLDSTFAARGQGSTGTAGGTGGPGGSGTGGGLAAGAVTVRPTPPARPLNPLAPSFTLAGADGVTIDASTLRGRASVLVFGGTWSVAWREALPGLRALAGDLVAGANRTGADGAGDSSGAIGAEGAATMIAVFFRERTPGAVSAGEHEPMTIAPAGDAAASAFGVKVVPTAVVLDADARVAAKIELRPGEAAGGFADRVREAVRALAVSAGNGSESAP
jgi:hypothetical protein